MYLKPEFPQFYFPELTPFQKNYIYKKKIPSLIFPNRPPREKFGNISPLGKFMIIQYPKDLELKETTECDKKIIFSDLLLSDDGELKCQVNDRRYYFSSDIINCPFMDSNIPK